MKEMQHLVHSLKAKLPFKLSIRSGLLLLLLICGFYFCYTVVIVIEKYYESIEITDLYTRLEIIDFNESTDVYNHSGLILDTIACRIPKLDPFDESVIHLFQPKEPYFCKGMPVFMSIQPNATIVLDETVLDIIYKVSPKNVSCVYNAIYRENEPEGYIGENTISWGGEKLLQFGVPLGEEFLKVKCQLGKENFIQYIPLVPLKPQVEKTKVQTARHHALPLNVVLIGIDSVSKLNFLRHFRRTHNFLTSNLSAFDMKGYTKVGDNTFPNLTPLLTGHFIEHYWNESISKNFFFDNLDFIWKKYSLEGYRTFYAEDGVYTGTFNYLKRGFKNPPTDYYSRPLGLAMADSELRKNGSGYCLNNQLEMEIFYGYLKNFLETMKSRLSFSFTMVSSLTHDNLNEAGYADEPTYNVLKHLHENGIINNSLIVVFSDHGIRFGKIRETYIGKFEERMPFMYLTLPKWFLDKNDDIYKNLKINQNRLITLFDVHATMYHLLNSSRSISESEKSTATPNGLSLMDEISEYRTCEMANILPHWCPCQVYQSVSKKDEIATKVATAIIDEINTNLQPVKDKCFQLEIDEITDVRLGLANEKVLRFVKHENDVINKRVVYGNKVNTLSDYLVTLRARPGNAMFEGTVRYDTNNADMKVLGISRINKYGQQSACINHPTLKRFCFCK